MLDQVKCGLQPAVHILLLLRLQVTKAEVEYDGNKKQPANQQQVRAKQQSPVTPAQEFHHAGLPQASGTSR